MFIAELKLFQGRQQIAQVRYFPLMNAARRLIDKVEKKKLKKGPTGCRCLLFCYPSVPRGPFLWLFCSAGGGEMEKNEIRWTFNKI